MCLHFVFLIYQVFCKCTIEHICIYSYDCYSSRMSDVESVGIIWNLHVACDLRFISLMDLHSVCLC